MRHRNLNSAMFAVLATAATVHGEDYQWTAVPLHPTGASTSQALAVYGPLQAGSFNYPHEAGRAVLWHGSSDNWTDLTPSWANLGLINGMDGDMQVGQVRTRLPADRYHAALWRGTAESAVDLHSLSGYRHSQAYAVVGSMQVGDASTNDSIYAHAAVWGGNAETFIDLHPNGATWSRAYTTDGTLQGGVATLPGGAAWEAVIWAGSAESIVNLTPPGAIVAEVRAMAPGVQLGYVQYQAGQNPRAALWRGTAESLVDLNPTGAAWSEVHGTDGSIHVGQAWFGTFSSAYVWLDGPEGVNLSEFLPPEYFSARATDVYRDGDTIYISGYADRGPREAWLWIGTIPELGTAMGLLAGLVVLCVSRRR